MSVTSGKTDLVEFLVLYVGMDINIVDAEKVLPHPYKSSTRNNKNCLSDHVYFYSLSYFLLSR